MMLVLLLSFLLLIIKTKAREEGSSRFLRDRNLHATSKEETWKKQNEKYSPDSITVNNLFTDWMGSFDIRYDTHDEMVKRFKVWMVNHEWIEQHNNQEPSPSYLLGHNQFSDQTQEEFRQRFFLGEYRRDFNAPSTTTTTTTRITPRKLYDQETIIPQSINWVTKGAVTAVKNQGQCGSCWAFSAIAAIESARAIETGELVSLSEQEILDCDLGDWACNGGYVDAAFIFDERSGGICSEEDYPYAMYRHWFRGCERYKSQCKDVPHTEVEKFVDVTQSENGLKAAIAKQPVSVAIEVTRDFQLYHSGIFDSNACGDETDHAVLVAGYGIENSTEYWLIKNSWGDGWGENGYIKMSVSSGNADDVGQCGILTSASYPILKDG